ncbi:MAG: proline dehydrogenase family protein [Actinomycetota bacterium]|nr:proline dehydrogenase family protein [Actinomycetota bacterium]
MPNRLLLSAANRPGLQQFVTKHTFTRRVASRFVAGSTLDEGIEVAAQLNKDRIGGILDYLGENISTEQQADHAAGAYLESLDAIASNQVDAHVSVKLTQLGLDLSVVGATKRMEKICAKASEIGTRVAIDMESHVYTDATIDVYRRLKASHPDTVLCLQAYLRRTSSDIESLLPIEPNIRLCKGAYKEPSEIAYDKRVTVRSYRNSIERLLRETKYTAVATHDDVLIDSTKRHVARAGIDKRRFEFQMLYGVRQQLQQSLMTEGFGVRVYIPFGEQWYPYLMRRLAERPANLRFFLESLVRG